MIRLKEKIKQEIFNKLKDSYPISLELLDLGYPPSRQMGDIALTFPFKLAQKIKKPPRKIAEEIIPSLSGIEEVEKVEVAGGGYLNLFLERNIFINNLTKNPAATSLRKEEKKIIIEHTNINPNKAAHIGHLRNAVLGDTLGRCLKYKGEQVEIQNYIDDTGVQVVDVVFGFLDLEKKKLPDIKSISNKFDYYCWDLYARVSDYLQKNPQAAQRRAEILKKVEEGEGLEAETAFYISRTIVKSHLKTMSRLGVCYDVLPCESSILRLKFWEKAFQLLKERKAIKLAAEGENKGCWTMTLENDPEREKIIVRSDGTVTYVGKDIAYQLWKFGLLDKDFYYQPFIKTDSKITWITTEIPNKRNRSFGRAGRVYNVIDSRQSYLQEVVVQGLKSLGFEKQARKSIHFAYEMVALSPRSLKEMNLEPPPGEEGKSFHEVSGRKGLGVKADDFLDRLEEKAMLEVEKRNPNLSEEQKSTIARQIACGALRYFMLKYTRNSLIIFDFEEALNFEGETGPYLQYSLVRMESIFRKLKKKERLKKEDILKLIKQQSFSLEKLTPPEKEDTWDLLFYASQMEEEVEHSVGSLEFSHLAKFTFNLCQKFNAYYHKYPILAEKNREIKNMRILTVYSVKDILRKALELMGIPQPEKM